MKYVDYLNSEKILYERSLVIIGEKLEYIEMLSELYRIPLETAEADENSHPSVFTVWWLEKLTLNSMYSAVQNYFRLQNFLCFASMRYGIETTLKAYYLQKNPDSIAGFLENTREFQQIKSSIRKNIEIADSEKDIIDFLFEVHSGCSSYGSHPDLGSIIRGRFRFSEDPNDDRAFFNYFQKPESENHFIREYLSYFPIYVRCLQIYMPYFENHTRLDKCEWDERSRRFTTDLNADIAKFNEYLNIKDSV